MFTQILTDTAFAFLPALICWSTFRMFGGSPVIGVVLGLMLVNPVLPNAYDVGQNLADPIVFFDFIKVLGYQGSVLPAFILTYTIGFRNPDEATKPTSNLQKKKSNVEVIQIASPIKGRAVALESVPDEAFASKAMGEGIAIEPSEGKVTAPFAGKVLHVMSKSKHAIILEHPTGFQMLIHVGLNTVSLKGQGFTAYVESGDTVQAGQTMLEFDISTIQEAGFQVITPIIIPDGQDNVQEVTSLVTSDGVTAGPLLRIAVLSK